MDVNEILFSLLRYELNGVPIEEQMQKSLNENTCASLFYVSEAHDISHIVASALCKISRLGNDEVSKKFRKKTMEALWRYEKLKNELVEISELFEKHGVIFVPLKGAIIRDYYPEPWMRTSCDIDILVRKKDVGKAISLLETALEYSASGECNYHDISLYSKAGIHLELHFSINEKNSSIDDVLNRVWDYVKPIEEGEFCCRLETEFFLFYFVAHAAYHFLDGGCGIRTLIDLYFIEQTLEYDEKKFFSFLNEAGLVKFYYNLKHLSLVLLSGAVHTALTKQMEEYILSGGLYGTLCNHISVQQNKAGGRFKYALGRIFISYDRMKKDYPFLTKHIWLTPFMHMYRWFRIICAGGMQRSISKLKVNAMIEKGKITETKKLLELLGL